MNGCAIPYTPIAVDYWKTRQCPRVKYFFLTHACVDQSCGLSQSWSLPIYCSPLTRKILLLKFSIRPEIVHELELNIQHSISLSNDEEDNIKVTLISSNYCPGSVMFFFEGYFGRILYTGNFRFREEMLMQTPLNDLLKISIDVLYLDNTYCNSKCIFPTKDTAMRTIIEIIENHRHKKIFIALKQFGKEELLISLSNHFRGTIQVDEDRLKILEMLKEGHNFTTLNSSGTSIGALRFNDIFEKVNLGTHFADPSICIVPTGLFKALGYNPFENHPDFCVVPYSNHSSYHELIKFVSLVHPKSIVPTNRPVSDPLTGALMDRTNVDCFQEFLDKCPMHQYHIPQSILKIMNQPTHTKNKRRTNKNASRKPLRKNSDFIDKTTAFETIREESHESTPSIELSSEELTRKPLNRKIRSRVSVHYCGPIRRISLPSPPTIKVLKRSKSLDSLNQNSNSNVETKCIQVNSFDLNISSNILVSNINFYQSSNLVRCHRARLCIPGQCQTVCYTKGTLNASSCSCQNSSEENDYRQKPQEEMGVNPLVCKVTEFDHSSASYSLPCDNSLTLKNVLVNKIASQSNSNNDCIVVQSSEGCIVSINHQNKHQGSPKLVVIKSDSGLSARLDRELKEDGMCNNSTASHCPIDRNAIVSDRFSSVIRQSRNSDNSMLTSEIDDFEPPTKILRTLEENFDSATGVNDDLPPKKKWQNKFKLSQINEIATEDKLNSKPTAGSRRRLGTTANPMWSSLNSIAGFPTTCRTSDSDGGQLKEIRSLFSIRNLIGNPAKPAFQSRCGTDLIKTFHLTYTTKNDLVSPTSPLDLSVSKFDLH